MQTDLTFTVTTEKLQEAISTSVDTILKSSYGNPFKDCIEKALKEKDGEIKKAVDSIISDVLNRPDFKEKLGEAMMARMVEATLKRN